MEQWSQYSESTKSENASGIKAGFTEEAIFELSWKINRSSQGREDLEGHFRKRNRKKQTNKNISYSTFFPCIIFKLGLGRLRTKLVGASHGHRRISGRSWVACDFLTIQAHLYPYHLHASTAMKGFWSLSIFSDRFWGHVSISWDKLYKHSFAFLFCIFQSSFPSKIMFDLSAALG